MSRKLQNSIASFSLSFFLLISFLIPLSTEAQPTGFTINFDVLPGVQPKILPLSGQLPVRLTATINLAQYGAHCGSNSVSSFKWTIYNEFGAVSPEKTASFARTQATVSMTINDTITVQDNDANRTGNYTYRFYAFIECPDGKNVTESSRVNIIAGGGQTTYTCVVRTGAGYAFSCSPANLNNCSDVSNCLSGTCSQIRVSLCGQAAPAPGSSGGQPGGGGSGGQPGQDVSVAFEIPNPIQAKSLIDLAKAIGRFLLQIAIPIAVIVIIYAGLLYLTSGGSKEKIATAHKALWYAVIGLAVILIGQGFFVLIKSILDLGGP